MASVRLKAAIIPWVPAPWEGFNTFSVAKEPVSGEKISKVCLGQPSQEELRQENETDAQECSELSLYTAKQ